MGQVFEEELLEEGSDGAGADADKDIVDSDLGVVFLAVGIVEAWRCRRRRGCRRRWSSLAASVRCRLCR